MAAVAHDDERDEHVQHAMVLARIDRWSWHHIFPAAYLGFDSANQLQANPDDLRIKGESMLRHDAREQDCRDVEHPADRHPAIEPDQEQVRSQHLHSAGL